MQVRLFSSRDHTRALAANDVWAIVGSSLDLIPLASRSSNISITAPVSGTALWADLWTVPAHASGTYVQRELWAAHFNTGFLIKLTPKGVVSFFLFFSQRELTQE